MTPDQEFTMGEMARSLRRIEASQEKLESLIPSVKVLETEMADIKPKVERAVFNAAFVAGGIAGGGWILTYLLKR